MGIRPKTGVPLSAEAEGIVNALKSGEVDAIVVSDGSEERVYTLQQATPSPEEAQEIVRALRSAEVDAIVAAGAKEHKVYRLRETVGALEETDEIVRALRAGEVDSIVVSGNEGEQVYALQGADYLYRIMIEAIGEGVALLGQDSSILHCSRRLGLLLDAAPDLLPGSKFRKHVQPSERAAFDESLRQASERSVHTESCLLSKKRSEIPVALSLRSVKLEDMTAICLVVRDLTAVKNAEAALRDSAEFNAQVIASAREGIAVMGPDLRYRLWNRRMEEMTGCSSSQVEGKSPAEVFTFSGDSRQECPPKALAGETVFAEGVYWVPGSGRRGWLSVIYSPLRDRHGKVVGALAIYRELTNEKLKEQELTTTTEELRRLTTRLNQIREEESQRISREIHDQLGGALSILKLNLSLLSQTPEAKSAALKERLQKSIVLTDQIVGTVQKIATELRPPGLDELGLAAVLQGVTAEFSANTGIRCNFGLDGAAIEASPNAAITVVRILQECLTNVGRHSGASRVDVEIKQRDKKILLIVRDNGKGFDTKAPSLRGSLGLLGMRERARSLGGEFSVRSAPGQTTVTVKIPSSSV